jgi:small subunit ribosomal protein S21
MLIIDVRDSENIDKALKKYKKKFEKARMLRQLRSRKHFQKPSIHRRMEVLKAVYVEKTYRGPNED